jgi:NADPH:quinone reductase-like Zn-dependent oxidoreductase
VRVVDVPTPVLPDARHVLVRLAAAALNHRDEWMRMVRMGVGALGQLRFY